MVFVWYCIYHGDCVITEDGIKPNNPCNTDEDCYCEMIYEIKNSGLWCRMGRSSHINIERYFDLMCDGYKLEYLERLVEENQARG